MCRRQTQRRKVERDFVVDKLTRQRDAIFNRDEAHRRQIYQTGSLRRAPGIVYDSIVSQAACKDALSGDSFRPSLKRFCLLDQTEAWRLRPPAHAGEGSARWDRTGQNFVRSFFQRRRELNSCERG